jgi:lipopolysaccharide/colanic/teichoic acid biosynthesis glycosyltransferase
MVRLDIQYATNFSLWQDFKILLKTPCVVFTGKGAY